MFVGDKDTYLNFALVPLREPDQYGNTHMAVQDLTEEERKSDPNMKGNIIGNAKVLEPRGGARTRPARPPAPPQAKTTNEDDDDVPF